MLPTSSPDNGVRTAEQRHLRKNFLRGFRLIELDLAVARRAITLRQERRLRLPDAIVWASALIHRAILISRNTKDFPRDHPGVRVPYSL